MKKVVVVLLGLFVIINTGFSQEKSDPRAKAYLDAMAQELNALKASQIDFELTIEMPNEESDVQKGTLVQKGDQYALTTPMREVYCDGKNLWLYNTRDNSVQVNDVEDGEDGGFMSPTSVFTSYQNGEYVYAITDEPIEKGVQKVKIDFKPVDRNSEYAKMTLYIVKTSKQIDRMKIFGKDASRFTMNILDFKKNPKVRESQFVFDASQYPNVYVEDLRID